MTVAWCVAVAVQGKLYLAAHQANEQGVPIFVPQCYSRERLVNNRAGIVTRPRIEPYFFVKIDIENEAEEALVRDLRGVETILSSFRAAGVRQRPKAIPGTVIQDFRTREFEELRGASVKPKKSRDDLELGKSYRIVRHPTFGGQEGVLVASVRGIAHLRVGAFLVELPDADVTPIVKKEKAAA